jgi:hypothetical protein
MRHIGGGDKRGRPGSLVTFFDMSALPRGRLADRLGAPHFTSLHQTTAAA